MNNENAPDERKLKIGIGEDVFHFVLARERGVQLYANAERSKYLRIGDPELAKKEVDFHKRLIEEGFPVAHILSEGEANGKVYWIEESLGNEIFTDRFTREVVENGKISEATFAIFLQHAKAVHEAQIRSCAIKPYTLDALGGVVEEPEMEAELPDFRDKTRAAWEKAKTRVEHLPICLTHGDFTAHNILEHGVIDFGDHFEGPLGHDMMNVITTPFWFPKDTSFELFGTYDFTEEQIDRFFAACGTSHTPFGTFELRDVFDDLFILKALWWAVRNQANPMLQEWRYERFRDIVSRYLSGESLYEYWRKQNNKK